MAYPQKQNAYIQTQINTASPAELTLMLYNGCIRFMKQALTAIENRHIPEKNENIQRAQAIVNELNVTLDMKYPISKELRMHYDFIYRKLIEANFKMDRSSLNFCIQQITELRDTWMEVMKQAKAEKTVQG